MSGLPARYPVVDETRGVYHWVRIHPQPKKHHYRLMGKRSAPRKKGQRHTRASSKATSPRPQAARNLTPTSTHHSQVDRAREGETAAADSVARTAGISSPELASWNSAIALSTTYTSSAELATQTHEPTARGALNSTAVSASQQYGLRDVQRKISSLPSEHDSATDPGVVKTITHSARGYILKTTLILRWKTYESIRRP